MEAHCIGVMPIHWRSANTLFAKTSRAALVNILIVLSEGDVYLGIKRKKQPSRAARPLFYFICMAALVLAACLFASCGLNRGPESTGDGQPAEDGLEAPPPSDTETEFVAAPEAAPEPETAPEPVKPQLASWPMHIRIPLLGVDAEVQDTGYDDTETMIIVPSASIISWLR
jgi:hypothetical protein